MLALGEHAEHVEHACDPPVAVRGIGAVDVRAHLEVLADRHVREHALAAGQEADAVLHALLGRDVGDRRAVQPHHTPRRRAEPGDHPEDRRLAGAVRSEQREHLAATDLEADVEQDLHVAVREVDGADLERRHLLRLHALAPLLVELGAELGHDHRQVVLDARGAAHDQQPAEQRRGNAHRQHRAPRPERAGEHRGEDALRRWRPTKNT